MPTAEELQADVAESMNSFDSFILNGHKIFAVPDLLYQTPSGCILVDWKTGKEDAAVRDQLLTYALYVLTRPEYRGQPVFGRVEYLGLNKHENFAYTAPRRLNKRAPSTSGKTPVHRRIK
ncbi:MAG: hypothetical protein EOL87_02095 [Spartobacteria bacterium]|nr:hypothetical protein [Spartobacteria bacterium]